MFSTSSLETQTLLSLLRLHAKGPETALIHDIIIEQDLRARQTYFLDLGPLEAIG
jgi:hypothetical protein